MKKAVYYVTIAALFLIPIFALFPMDFWPFSFPHDFYFPFITGKAIYFRILVEVAFAGWLLLALIDPRYRPRITPITLTITIFAVITLIADLIGMNPLRSLWSNFERMEGWMMIIHLWAFFMAGTHLLGTGEHARALWHRWFNWSIIVAIIVGFYGFLQLFGVAEIHQGSTRIDASLGNAAYMAVYLLWNIGLCMYLYTVARAGELKNAAFLSWAYPILAAVFSFLLFATATRGTILGWTGGILVALFVYAVWGRGMSKKSRWISGAIIIVIALIGIGLVSAKNSSFVKNNEALNRVASISLSNPETASRLYIWQMALKGWEQRPILGWGQENFNFIFNANYNPKMWNQEQWFDRAHSVYLDWLTASGAVGLLAYLALYVVLVISIWKSGLTVARKSILTGLLAGYAVHNIFVFDNLASYIYFTAALAFVNSLRPHEGRPLGGDKHLSKEAAEYVIAPAVIVALVLVVWFYNARVVSANKSLIQALSACNAGHPDAALYENALNVGVTVANQETREQLLSCAGATIANPQISAQIKESFYKLATKAISDQIAMPKMGDARIYVLAGTFMNMIGQATEAEKYYATAHTLSPHKQSLDVDYATTLINTGKGIEAEKILAEDYALTPENPYVKSAYAVALIVNGKEPQAREIFKDDPTLFESMTMAQAYTVAKQYTKAAAIYMKLHQQSPEDFRTTLALAQAQYAAGQKQAAFATLREIAKLRPDLKDQIEATIKSAQ